MQKSQLLRNNLASLIVIALFLFTVLEASAPARTLAAQASGGETIGYVNKQKVFADYPDIQTLLKRIQAMREEAQKDYDTNAKDLPPAEKKAYNDKIALQEAQREDELMKPVMDKIKAVIEAVAEENGLTVVFDAGAVVYGGMDITFDVVAKVKQ